MIPPSLRRKLRQATSRLDRLESDRLARAGERLPFGLEWKNRYLPRYSKLAPSRLHLELARDLFELTTLRGQKRNYVAPRGSAKTTWLSKAFPLHQAVTGVEPLILLLAETGKLAKSYLTAIKRELETNRQLAADYPDACGRGPVWQATHVRLRNGCEIMAAGSGGRVLGTTAGEFRPTLVILDDGNERGDAYSPTKRERKLDWFKTDILPIGEPGTNFVVAGTPIHREAIVCRLRADGWATRSYRALYRDPDRVDLWTEYGRLLTNLADPHRVETAAAFLAARAGEMAAGADLLWPERLTLRDLMAYRLVNGEQAYRTEYTDDPGSPEGAEWPAELFDWPGFWFDDWPQDLLFKVIALDPSKGASAKAGDYQAHAMVGLGRDGTLYVDADLRRETPEDMCLRTVHLAREWGRAGRPVDSVILEDNGTMGLIAVAVRLAEDKLKAVLPWQCLTHTDPKPLRIRVASGWLHRRKIRVRSTPGGRQLVEQWRDFPFGSNDDGPDGVATGIIRVEQLAGYRSS